MRGSRPARGTEGGAFSEEERMREIGDTEEERRYFWRGRTEGFFFLGGGCKPGDILGKKRGRKIRGECVGESLRRV